MSKNGSKKDQSRPPRISKCQEIAQTRPWTTLILTVFVWKALFIVIALASPSRAYDTSTEFLLDGYESDEASGSLPLQKSMFRRIALKLTRWDAIYFVTIPDRGYLYEQEWAFSFGFTKLIAFVSKALSYDGSDLTANALTGILIAHLTHLLSVLLLYKILSSTSPAKRNNVFGALLHCIAPAGIFLSAPCSESLYSLLSFCGVYLFCFAHHPDKHERLTGNACMVLSGLVFGLAATVRSNGLLSVLAYVCAFFQSWFKSSTSVQKRVLHISALAMASLFVVAGFAIPQILAYKSYCLDSTETINRPWCQKVPPSITTFVQEHYWNVGFLRYWTVSNLPLFLLATPMLFVMMSSSAWGLAKSPSSFGDACIQCLAVTQAALTVLTLTNFHVQIITRLASGYPLVYIWLNDTSAGSERKKKLVVRFMVMYSVVQAGLFASFLPPA